MKKGYYIRRVKESLWSTFGISRLKPYDDNYSREQMKNWKKQENVKKAYDAVNSEIRSQVNVDLLRESLALS